MRVRYLVQLRVVREVVDRRQTIVQAVSLEQNADPPSCIERPVQVLTVDEGGPRARSQQAEEETQEEGFLRLAVDPDGWTLLLASVVPANRPANGNRIERSGERRRQRTSARRCSIRSKCQYGPRMCCLTLFSYSSASARCTSSERGGKSDTTALAAACFGEVAPGMTTVTSS